jgi:hypothetical protein
MSERRKSTKETLNIFDLRRPHLDNLDIIEIDSSKAQFAAVLGAMVFAILNIGHYIGASNSPSRVMFSFDLHNTSATIAFTLMVFGPVYSWFLVRITHVSNKILGFYLGMSTVALFQSFADFYVVFKH